MTTTIKETPNSSISNKQKSAPSSGPIFDKKHNEFKLLKLTGYAVLAIFIIALFYNHPWTSDIVQEKPLEDATTISVLVTRGDGKTKLARRALSEYLVSHSDISLSNAQKVFIEEILKTTLTDASLKVGNSVEINKQAIEKAVADSKNLTPIQVKAWEDYAKRVKF